jgi:hypothetical protein
MKMLCHIRCATGSDTLTGHCQPKSNSQSAGFLINHLNSSHRVLPDALSDMRLLNVNADGSFSLTQFNSNQIPPYAILSHRWEKEEVTYQDLMNGVAINKAGYRKICFCGEQAKNDDLEYFWVVSCCTIQTHHRRQRPTKRVAYAAENGGIMYIAFQYKRINIHYCLPFPSENP